MALPPGVKFMPTNQQLIQYYLAPKLRNELVLPSFIHILDRPLYGTQLPWQVLTDQDPWQCTYEDNIILKHKEIYVFTPLIQTGQKKKRVQRIAGSGTWGGKQVSHDIKDGEKILGTFRSFTFMTDGVLEANQGRWRMHEFSIGDADLVLCKIIVDNFPKSAAHQNLGGKKRKTYCDQPRDDGDLKRLCPPCVHDGQEAFSMPPQVVTEGEASTVGFDDNGPFLNMPQVVGQEAGPLVCYQSTETATNELLGESTSLDDFAAGLEELLNSDLPCSEQDMNSDNFDAELSWLGMIDWNE